MGTSAEQPDVGPMSRWDEDELAPWMALLVTGQLLTARLGTELRRGHGLSLEDYGVLIALEAAPDCRVRMGELAEAALVSQSRLSHQVTRMESRGLVTREPSRYDRRGADVVLTEAGKQSLMRAAPDHIDAVRREFLAHLSERDRQRLTTILRPVLASLLSSPALARLLPPPNRK
ncbi:winged helix-turn-helix transcriptional regulator [Nocardia colli]|uniref:Winged helix-turn-helix transcriptional regulator n=1 Tax=Nocardia colli TaxID=2545717 RepID=A0A5N0EKU8_9NOCA|nr:MarR family winged helix-turn-helix transcriptional regulator [Nocardia colli]KAA8889470.1 winged helix-turn-helix transcriptional regulator [Nocardia colli]